MSELVDRLGVVSASDAGIGPIKTDSRARPVRVPAAGVVGGRAAAVAGRAGRVGGPRGPAGEPVAGVVAGAAAFAAAAAPADYRPGLHRGRGARAANDGLAYNYLGQRAGRPHLASWAEAGFAVGGGPTGRGPGRAAALRGPAAAGAGGAARCGVWPPLGPRRRRLLHRPSWSTTSMVADSLWGSTPMITCSACCMCCSRLRSFRCGRRGGHCYYEQGSPFLSHASSR